MKIAVCYYPEQWPQQQWADDARKMRECGISTVRIAEFSWSRIEPEEGKYHWDWLDQAIATLLNAGLDIILCTPTATPPKWLIDKHPEILAVDDKNQIRTFGSRRHYCFSSDIYREYCKRIVTDMANRYKDSRILAWQIDNEYGCHNTTVSYSPSAIRAFRGWLAQKYSNIERLNQAWGTVFWSQEYLSFDVIDPPHMTVTEANPAHRLDYRHFCSDQVVSFNRLQVEILKQICPSTDITHNFMGFYEGFDHFDVAEDLDIASWDSYPLGFLDQGWDSDEDKVYYLRKGHPDFAAFHHDLYRGCGNGRMWVMEQQPGPVNWAPNNPSPELGMVRLWSWEAFAHGAELVSYFRWRQAPFAQEQMHSGLNLSNGEPDEALHEVKQVHGEILKLALSHEDLRGHASVALIFDYPSKWLIDIQPQGELFDYWQLIMTFYSTARQLGVSIDIISPNMKFSKYAAVVIPCQPIIDDVLLQRLKDFSGEILVGPRSGSKTKHYQIPNEQAPGPLQQILPISIPRVESLRKGADEAVIALCDGKFERWIEWVNAGSTINKTALASDRFNGKKQRGGLYQQKNIRYLAGWPNPALCQSILTSFFKDAGIATTLLPKGLRLRQAKDYIFAFNYSDQTIDYRPNNAELILGSVEIGTADLSIWKKRDDVFKFSNKTT